MAVTVDVLGASVGWAAQTDVRKDGLGRRRAAFDPIRHALQLYTTTVALFQDLVTVLVDQEERRRKAAERDGRAGDQDQDQEGSGGRRQQGTHWKVEPIPSVRLALANLCMCSWSVVA